MNNILLVAQREFRQIATLRSFWLILLLVPAALALGPIFANYFDDVETSKVILVDKSGGSTAEAVRHRYQLEHDLATLTALSRYVRRYELEHANSIALWTRHDRLFTPADVMAFRATGGLESALGEIARVKPSGTRAFEADSPRYEFLPPPLLLATAPNEAEMKIRAETLLDRAKNDDAVDMVVFIGPRYPHEPVVQLIANDQPLHSFVATLQDVLTRDLQQRMLVLQGLPAQTAIAVQTATPAIAVSIPPPGGGMREAIIVRSVVPLALSYSLMIGLMLSGGWMLQSSIEERTNKLIESLLACIKPEELMYGKLVGTLAVGFSMFLFWVFCAAIAAFATKGIVAEYIRPALEPISSPGAIFAIFFFFIAGYVAISILFMAIGALSDSMSDAQGFLMPLMFLIMIPILGLLQSILEGKIGTIGNVLTWIPLWTPFAVLARLGAGISAWEIIGAGLLLTISIAVEIVLLGRLFRKSLLLQGQKLTWRGFVDGIRAAD